MKEKQVMMTIPSWVKTIEDDDVAGAIVGLMFSSSWNEKVIKGDNLEKYIRVAFEDLSDKQVKEVADLLREHSK